MKRLEATSLHQNCNTVILTPTRGSVTGSDFIPLRWHRAISQLVRPINSRIHHQECAGAEVGQAYNALVSFTLKNPTLSTWPYILTCEDDTLMPRDGLLSLLADIGDYDALAGVYFTKEDNGHALMYGDPTSEGEINFRPRIGPVDSIIPVYGAGMGFTLFKMDVFRKLEEPWFKTYTDMSEGMVDQGTQDIYFFRRMAEAGMKVAVSTKVRCTHLDTSTDRMY